MKLFAIFVVLGLLIAVPAGAQESEPQSVIVVGGNEEPQPRYVEEVVVYGEIPDEGLIPPTTKNQVIVTGVYAASAMLDAASTRGAIRRGGEEGNGIIRPFAGSDAALYGYQAATTIGVALLGNELTKHEKTRKWWWVPAGFGTGLHLAAKLKNDGVHRDRRPR